MNKQKIYNIDMGVKNVEDRFDAAVKVTWFGLIINSGLTLLKIIAGILGRSSAMLADGIHSLSDFFTDIIVLIGFHFVRKPADKTHDYGHGKFETLIATIIGLILFFAGGNLLICGIRNIVKVTNGYILFKPGIFALYAAVISIVFKEWLYRYTIKVGKKIKSNAIIANAIHHRSDMISSVGAFFGIGGAIFFGEKWRVLDPIAAVLVSFIILKAAISILLGSVNELLEVSLSEDMENKILQVIRNTPSVRKPHNMKTRKIGNDIAIDVHIKVDNNLNVVQAHDIATMVEINIKEEFGDKTFISIHIEPFEE